MKNLTGTCTCKSIEYTADPKDVLVTLNCHCSLCRKLTGASFNTYVGVKSEGFNVTKGEDNIAVYNKPDTTVSKHFCKTCGTPLFNVNPKYGDIKIVYFGSLTEDNGLTPNMNIFCDNKVEWLDTLFDCPNNPQGPEV